MIKAPITGSMMMTPGDNDDKGLDQNNNLRSGTEGGGKPAMQADEPPRNEGQSSGAKVASSIVSSKEEVLAAQEAHAERDKNPPRPGGDPDTQSSGSRKANEGRAGRLARERDQEGDDE